MTGDGWLELLREHRVVALVRADSLELTDRLARLAIAAGLNLVEIAWNNPGAAQMIAMLRQDFPDCTIGAGTILSAFDAQAAIAAGAQFLFSPHTDLATLGMARSVAVPCVPGALTPTEIHQAQRAGATAIKLFPIAAVGGVDYLRAVRATLDRVAFVPTGGVTLETAEQYLAAGAIAVALSSALFPREWVERRDWRAIEGQIGKLRSAIASRPSDH